MSDDLFSSLSDKIGAAAFQTELWPSVLTDMASFASARGVVIIPVYDTGGNIQLTESLAEPIDIYVAEGWSAKDYRYRGINRMMKAGIAVDQDFVDADTMNSEPFYTDYLRRFGLKYFAGLGLRYGSDMWSVAIQRGVCDDPFGREEQERLVKLREPLIQAVRVNRALGEAYALGSVDMLSRRPTASLLLDRRGLVTYLNSAAEALVGTVIDIRRGHIRLKSRVQTDAILNRIKATLDDASGAATSIPGSMLIGDERTLYVARVTRLTGLHESAFQTYRTLVEIARVPDGIKVDKLLMADAFRLTRRELEIVEALFRTRSLAEAAVRIGVSHETARSHLKSVLQKTGTRGQVELAALMANVALTGS